MMIFLFLTGTRLAYVNDILMTLYLPRGAVKTLKYKYTSGSRQDGIVDASAALEHCQREDDVIIFYYDEDKEGKQGFIPLRRGKLLSCICEDGQLYYRVQLGNFCFSSDHEQLNEEVASVLYPEGYEKYHHIRLAVRSASGYQIEHDFIDYTEESWIYTAHRMAKTERFQKYYTVFAKISMFEAGKNKELICGENGYHLNAGKGYYLVLSYYVPHFNEKPFSEIPFLVSDAMRFCRIPENSNYFESEQNRLEIPFRPMKVEENGQTMLFTQVLQKKVDGKQIYYPMGMLPISVKGVISPLCKYLCVAGLVAGIGLTSYIVQFPFMEKLTQLNSIIESGAELSRYEQFVLDACGIYEKYSEIITGTGAALNAFLTFLLVKITGKPKI